MSDSQNEPNDSEKPTLKFPVGKELQDGEGPPRPSKIERIYTNTGPVPVPIVPVLSPEPLMVNPGPPKPERPPINEDSDD